ncbi:MAG TPA: hypothetical protein VFJ61_13515 [Solirubrobacterales bacterium]|nr:hypothetical protein [Solirubrobacterales bacterium]
MSSGDDSLPIAVQTAQDQDLKPLLEESAEALELDDQQLAAMDTFLHKTWFFGVKTGHRVIAEAKLGDADPAPVILGMQDEFQDLMEGLAEELNLTVGATIAAWNYLGQAWLAGARFWEVEIAARLIESQAGGFDEALRRLEG